MNVILISENHGYYLLQSLQVGLVFGSYKGRLNNALKQEAFQLNIFSMSTCQMLVQYKRCYL